VEGSESKSAEEEFGVSSLFVFLGVGKISNCLAEGLLEVLSKSNSALLGLQVIVLDVLKIKVVDNESGGDDMVLVDVFDERLNVSFLDELLLAVGSLDEGEVTSNTSDEKMRESMLLTKSRATLLPSSKALTTTAFFPANLPCVRMTTLPILKLNRELLTFCPLMVWKLIY
jgi:hypothetical protein